MYHFNFTPEYKAAFILFIEGVKSEELNKIKTLPDPIRNKVMNELIKLEKKFKILFNNINNLGEHKE